LAGKLRKGLLMFDDMKWTWKFYREGLRMIRRRGEAVPNGRFLLIQNTGLGDACQFVPFARALGRSGFRLVVSAPARFRTLYERFVRMERFLALPSPVADFSELSALLGRRAYEATFSVSMNRDAALAAAVSGSRNRYGMVEDGKYYRGSRLFYSDILHVGRNIHVTRRYRDLIRLHVPDFKPDRSTVPGNTVSPGMNGIVIHPGGKWRPRRWPAENYRDLVGELVQGGGRVTVLLHPSEPDLVRFFRNQDLPDGVSLLLLDSLQALMDTVESCSYFIGNDSGPAHLANLLGRPMTVVWGPGDADRIRPLGTNVRIVSADATCRPCRQYVHPEFCQNGVNDCLRNVSVDDVLEAVDRHLSEQRWYSFTG
jgi:ADP-heptose:LPS heptosyltransferase